MGSLGSFEGAFSLLFLVIFIFSVYFTTVIMPEGGSVVWAYMTGITAILVAMVAPFLGSYADSSGKFKELIVFFICIGKSYSSKI